MARQRLVSLLCRSAAKTIQQAAASSAEGGALNVGLRSFSSSSSRAAALAGGRAAGSVCRSASRQTRGWPWACTDARIVCRPSLGCWFVAAAAAPNSLWPQEHLCCSAAAQRQVSVLGAAAICCCAGAAGGLIDPCSMQFIAQTLPRPQLGCAAAQSAPPGGWGIPQLCWHTVLRDLTTLRHRWC